MLNSEEIKSITLELGADKCGIASIDRFNDAPKGFRPSDIYSKCKSLVVFIKKMPSDVIMAENHVPYSHTAYLLYSALDQIGLNFSLKLEKYNIHGVPLPTDVPYLFWDAENQRGQGIISMRHAAFNAGLGILGRNTLLINQEFGNMIYIGAILLDTEFEPDPIITDFSCPSNCRLCLDACPVQALNGITVNQKLCRGKSCIPHERGWDIYSCNSCRKICPYRNGKNSKAEQLFKI
jgi:epoxyqueuosine reductase